MKKLVLILSCLLISSVAFGQFTNIGIAVNPFVADPDYDINSSLAGTVEYWVFWDPSPADPDPFDKIWLMFGSSGIFESATFNGIVSGPAGWGATNIGSASEIGYYLELAGPMTMNGIRFRVDYTLFEPATIGDWNSKEIWSQSYMGWSSGVPNPGSMYLTPEPTTLLLLGLGFVGMGTIGYLRRRKK